MGKGPRSTESRVRKERQAFSDTSSGHGGGFDKDGGTDSCLISFPGNLSTTPSLASQITRQSPVAIVPGFSNFQSLNVFIGGINFGAYNGPFKTKILRCISKGFVYEGVVLSLEKTNTGVSVRYRIDGRGR